MLGLPARLVITALVSLTALAACGGATVEGVRGRLTEVLCALAAAQPVPVFERPAAVYKGEGSGRIGVVGQDECRTAVFEGSLRRAEEVAAGEDAPISGWFRVSAGPIEGWVGLSVPRDVALDLLPAAVLSRSDSSGPADLAVGTTGAVVNVGDPCFDPSGVPFKPGEGMALFNRGPGPTPAKTIRVEYLTGVGLGGLFIPAGLLTDERISSGRPWTGAEAMAALRSFMQEYDNDTLVWASRGVVLTGDPFPDLEPALLSELVELANLAMDLEQRKFDIGFDGEAYYRVHAELSMYVGNSAKLNRRSESVALTRPLEAAESVQLPAAGPTTVVVADLGDQVEESDESNNAAYVGESGELVCRQGMTRALASAASRPPTGGDRKLRTD